MVTFAAGCGRLDDLAYDPPTTPAQWCAGRPCIDVGGVVFNEPLGSFLVFSLAALWAIAGARFIATRRDEQSRLWLGVALVLGGVGAAQAGISFQAFSYELKCAGRELCRLTNGFEVGYSVTQAVSVSAMLLSIAYACAGSALRQGLILYAVVNAIAYVVVALLGVMLPSRTLLSFEVLMLFALPGTLLLIVVAGRRWVAYRDAMDRDLVVAAVLLLGVQAAFFSYAAAGIRDELWQGGRGFYFSENDVLHIGMIAWLGYVWAALGPKLRDRRGLS